MTINKRLNGSHFPHFFLLTDSLENIPRNPLRKVESGISPKIQGKKKRSLRNVQCPLFFVYGF